MVIYRHLFLALLFFMYFDPASAVTIGLKCQLITYDGPQTSYGKFETINGGLIDLDNQRVDLVSTKLKEMWTYANGKPGTTSADDRAAIQQDSSTVFGGGIRFGSAFAFEFNRENHTLIWTGVWSQRKSTQTWKFDCAEGAAPKFE